MFRFVSRVKRAYAGEGYGIFFLFASCSDILISTWIFEIPPFFQNVSQAKKLYNVYRTKNNKRTDILCMFYTKYLHSAVHNIQIRVISQANIWRYRIAWVTSRIWRLYLVIFNPGILIWDKYECHSNVSMRLRKWPSELCYLIQEIHLTR